jgi:diaminopimelate decarboxylase
VKANGNLSILKTLIRLGAGLDIVSGGELFRALKAGCPANRIVFAGVGKTEAEIQTALQAGILSFNTESEPELDRINRVASRLKKKTRIALRINPDIDAGTHAKITTGKAGNKFGISFKECTRILKNRHRYPWLLMKGLHVHIGSQIIEPAPFKKAFEKLLKFADSLKKQGISIDSLDLGGGLGIRYCGKEPLTPEAYGALAVKILKNKNYKILLEPGRFIAGNSGALVTQVQYLKKTEVKNFIIVDSAMNELVRPAMYEAYHEIVPVKKPAGGKKIKADIVGPICETGDVLGYSRLLPEPKSGDLFAILSAGAYGFSMSSNYNARPRPTEVLVKGSTFRIIRRRETFQDLIAREL